MLNILLTFSSLLSFLPYRKTWDINHVILNTFIKYNGDSKLTILFTKKKKWVFMIVLRANIKTYIKGINKILQRIIMIHNSLAVLEAHSNINWWCNHHVCCTIMSRCSHVITFYTLECLDRQCETRHVSISPRWKLQRLILMLFINFFFFVFYVIHLSIMVYTGNSFANIWNVETLKGHVVFANIFYVIYHHRLNYVKCVDYCS